MGFIAFKTNINLIRKHFADTFVVNDVIRMHQKFIANIDVFLWYNNILPLNIILVSSTSCNKLIFNIFQSFTQRKDISIENSAPRVRSGIKEHNYPDWQSWQWEIQADSL